MEDENAYVPGFSDQLWGLQKQLQKAIRKHCRLMGQNFAQKARGGYTLPRPQDTWYQARAQGCESHREAYAGSEVSATVEEGEGERDPDGENKPAMTGTAWTPYAP